MTIVPVEYPTQEDLERLALLDAHRKRNVRIIRKVALFVLVPIVLLFATCALDGYIVNGVAGMKLGLILAFVAVLGLMKTALVLVFAALVTAPLLLCGALFLAPLAGGAK